MAGWPGKTTGVLFIHGAGLGSWIWREMVEELAAPCLLADFPHAENGGDRTDLSLDDYVEAIRLQAEEWIAPRFVIVAHSIGGLIGLKLAERMADRVAGFIAVGAAIPKNGRGAFLSALPAPNRWIMGAILRKGNTLPPEKAIRNGLCSGLDEAKADAVVNRYARESVRLFTDKLGSAIPNNLPKCYVQLAEDKELGPGLQKKMIRHLAPQTVKTLQTGHLPMLADPAGLRRVIEDFLASLPGEDGRAGRAGAGADAGA